MAEVLLLYFFRGFVAIVLLLQAHPALGPLPLCPQEHCVYLPITSNPVVVTIHEIEGWGGKYGRSGAFGEVVNNSNFPVYNVAVQATFIGLLGVPLSSTNTTVLTATLPGQVNRFYVGSPDAYGALIDSKVLSWDIAPLVPLSNLTVVTLFNYLTPSDPPVYSSITGTLRNDTNNTIKDVQIYLWYVKDISLDRQVILQVSPGATVVFTSAFGKVTQRTDTIRIVAQGVFSP